MNKFLIISSLRLALRTLQEVINLLEVQAGCKTTQLDSQPHFSTEVDREMGIPSTPEKTK